MIVNEGLIVEIVRSGTGEPVADGEVGEVVVTAFNPDYPMIRLATGQLAAVMRGRSPCGRTNMRIRGEAARCECARLSARPRKPVEETHERVLSARSSCWASGLEFAIVSELTHSGLRSATPACCRR